MAQMMKNIIDSITQLKSAMRPTVHNRLAIFEIEAALSQSTYADSIVKEAIAIETLWDKELNGISR